MAGTDRSLLDLSIASAYEDDDTVVSVVSGKAVRVRLGDIYKKALQWSSIQNKPFSNVDSDDFTVTSNISGISSLSLSPTIREQVHTHTNKSNLDKIGEDAEGNLLYNTKQVVAKGEWDLVLNKPFESISEDDFDVDDNSILSISDTVKNQLHSHDNKETLDKLSVDESGNLLFNGSAIVPDGISFSALSEMLIEGDNITIAADEDAQTIKINASGMDFSALSNALTTGTQTGIEITANSDTNSFNFTVDNIPEIAIDSDGYWTVDGERGENPTKAQGEKGNDGFTPTISTTALSNGFDITITNSDGSQTIGIRNGENGKSAYEIAVERGYIGTEEEWLAGLKGKDGAIEITTSKIDYTITLLADNWSNTIPYTQTCTLAEMTEEINPRVDLIVSDSVSLGIKEETAFAYLTRGITGDGCITFQCYESKPDVDLNIQVEVI